eukprot:COSAG01_NODE_74_length_28433_cov_41.582269_20_plen_55_part_00
MILIMKKTIFLILKNNKSTPLKKKRQTHSPSERAWQPMQSLTESIDQSASRLIY